MDDCSANSLKKVLRLMPAPVGIVTSSDEEGKPVGLAMSAIMPVSLEPCSMAVAINRTGSSHKPILASKRFCLNLLDRASIPEFTPFAVPGEKASRFAGAGWKMHEGLPYLAGAPANIFCSIEDTLAYGTHDLLIGKVFELFSSEGDEMLGWCNGALGNVAPLEKA